MSDGTTQSTLARGGSEGTQGSTSPAGAQSVGWRAGLKTELRDHPLVKQYGNVSDFAKAAIDLAERNSHAIQIPGDKATPEELAAFAKAIGVPESEDGYTFDTSKMPTDWEGTPEFEAFFKSAAKEAGVTKAAAQGLYLKLVGRAYEGAKKQSSLQKEEEAKEEAETVAARKKVEEGLRSEYKGDFEKNIRDARQLCVSLGGEALIKELDESGLGDRPLLIRALVKAAHMISPDQLVTDSQANKGDGKHRRDIPLEYPWMREFYGIPSE